jgi:predicted nucleic acid-binding protein
VIVLSDTSPINYLVLIGHIDVLPVLFGQVIVPPAVFQELQHARAPAAVREWTRHCPAWFEVRLPGRVDHAMQLGRGEREAICLASELGADLLLMDDRRARRFAAAQGLNVAGTLNVLEAAAQRQLLDLPDAIAKLRQTSFHVSEEILANALAADAERKRQAD